MPTALTERLFPLPGAVLAGADQSEREGWKPGWWRGDHREEQEQDHCYFRGALLQEVRT